MENDLVGYGKCPHCKRGGNLATIMDHARTCPSNPKYRKQLEQLVQTLKIKIKPQKKKRATLKEAMELLNRALAEIGSTELSNDIRDFLGRCNQIPPRKD